MSLAITIDTLIRDLEAVRMEAIALESRIGSLEYNKDKNDQFFEQLELLLKQRKQG